MNIINLSSYDFEGAGIAALRFHQNLLKNGHRSALIVKESRVLSNEGVIEVTSHVSRLLEKFKSRLRIFIHANSRFQNNRYTFLEEERFKFISSKDLIRRMPFKPDAIVLHWISNFITSRDVSDLYRILKVPVVWYLLDMAPLTGGCHYSWGCNHYMNFCGKCPALESDCAEDVSCQALKSKKQNLRDVDLIVVAGSPELFIQAKQAAVFQEKPIHKILVAIDPEKFKPPNNKEQAKHKLGLHEDCKTILFGASSLTQERKGMKYLLSSFQRLSSLLLDIYSKIQIRLIVAGNCPSSVLDQLPFEYVHLGKLKDERQLIKAYQAADVFACPSIQDSGPMMINEALMCGLPIVSFDGGVTSDLVLNGITGERCKAKDFVMFSQAMLRIICMEQDEYNKMIDNCRSLAMHLYHPTVQISQLQDALKQHV